MSGAKDFLVQPKGFTFDHFKNDRGQTIRYGQMQAQTPKAIATLVLGPGYGEPIEKYFEVINDLTRQGYDLYIIDWMGQGGSDRADPADPQKPYDVKNFIEHHRDDLHHLATKIVKAPDTHKIAYMGFSMGAHIGLRFLERYNYIFDAASMNAGFFDMHNHGVPRALIPTMAKSLRLAGKGRDYVRGGGPWTSLKHEFNKNNKTSDPRRHRRMVELFENKKDLQLGDVTVDWVHHVLPSIRHLNKKDTLAQIITPIQVAIAGRDQTVSNAAQLRALKYLPNATSRHYKTSRHELWMEDDRIRQHWLYDTMRFIRSTLEADLKPVRFERRLLQQKKFSHR